MVNRFWIQKNSKRSYFDTLLLLILILLILFGLVVLYSVSSYDGYVEHDGDSWYYFRSQLKHTVIGLGAMAFGALFPYKNYRKLPGWIYLFGLASVLALIPFGNTVNGAKRWINIFGINVQPAEIAKVAIIIVCAHLLVVIGERVNTLKGFAIILVPALILGFLVMVISSNLSSAIIIVGIAVAMAFVTGKKYKWYVLTALIGIAVAAIAILIVTNSQEGALGYRGERIRAWLDPEAYASGKGYQTVQSLYAIGSGGLFGKGIGQSMQKLGYIPEAQNDMIFAVICEELGFFGAICVILMFILLLWRCFIIAFNATDMFGSLLVVGFMAHIAIQVVLNIAVVTNTIPNTGISLPFISYGGSAIVCTLFEVGMVMSVGRSIKVREI